MPAPWPLRPMLATLAKALPANDAEWAYEFKWDGIRAVTRLHRRSLQILTRNQIDITGRYPELASLTTALGRRDVVLDGEIVGFDAEGRATFEALQQRMGLEGGRRVAAVPGVAVAYMIFDIAWLDGRSLLSLPYTERREQVEALDLDGDSWLTPGFVAGGGEALLAASREQHLEGIIAKRLDSLYQPGARNGLWLKVKNQQRQEFVIGGWVPGAGRRSGMIGALVLGYYDQGRLISAGKVGTGFTDQGLRDLQSRLQPLHSDESPFDGGEVPRDAVFVRPELVCEVEFTEWTTRTNQLRHPSFKGLRDDKPPRDVVREAATRIPL